MRPSRRLFSGTFRAQQVVAVLAVIALLGQGFVPRTLGVVVVDGFTAGRCGA
jgi:hypothetical protein